MGFFEGLKESTEKLANKTPDEWAEELATKKDKKENDNIEAATKEVEMLLGKDEKVLFVHKFWNDKMVATNKKLIYVDLRIAKDTTYAMIPYNRITSYALTMPTGFSTKTKLKIFTGGDEPSIVVDANFDSGIKEFCKVLADNI